MAIFNIHAGHNRAGAVACGAVGILDESKEAREVKNRVITMLRAQGHTVYDCTVDDGTSQNDVLTKIVKKCNAHKVDLDVSIHFNAGGGNGTEVLVYSTTSKSKTYADRTVQSIAELGFKNRGVKTRTDLYFLKKTASPAMLIECNFVDSQTDANLYNPDKMAAAIVKGITGVTGTVQTSTPTPHPTPSTGYSKTQFVKEVQSAIGAKVDGIAGNETLSKTVTVSKTKNNRHAVVKPLQKYLNFLGYDCGTADGIAGAKFDTAVKAYQRDHGCVADGIITAGKMTWKKLLGLA